MLIFIVAPIWFAIYALASIWGASQEWLQTIGIVGVTASLLIILGGD